MSQVTRITELGTGLSKSNSEKMVNNVKLVQEKGKGGGRLKKGDIGLKT